MDELKEIREQLIRHEGLRLKPYRCPAGKLTIGIGRNLEDKGLTEKEAEVLLENDIFECTLDLNNIFEDFKTLPKNVRFVLLDMRFNLGHSGFRSFRNMIQSVKDKDYRKMIECMKASKWYGQVGNRSKNLVKMIEEILN